MQTCARIFVRHDSKKFAGMCTDMCPSPDMSPTDLSPDMPQICAPADMSPSDTCPGRAGHHDSSSSVPALSLSDEQLQAQICAWMRAWTCAIALETTDGELSPRWPFWAPVLLYLRNSHAIGDTDMDSHGSPRRIRTCLSKHRKRMSHRRYAREWSTHVYI